MTGGILTVTVSALLEDPFEVSRVLKLVDQHPLWMCYIHPYVLAALIRRDYPDSDPRTLVQSWVFPARITSVFAELGGQG